MKSNFLEKTLNAGVGMVWELSLLSARASDVSS